MNGLNRIDLLAFVSHRRSDSAHNPGRYPHLRHAHWHHAHRAPGSAFAQQGGTALTPAAANTASLDSGSQANAPSGAGAGTTPALTYQRTENAALYIRTQEGDTVALKISARDALGADLSREGSATELKLSGSSNTKIAVYVHGNLNPDELAAVQDVVQQAGALAEQFFAGDAQAAFAAAAGLNIDGSQLAKVGLRLGLRERSTYSELSGAPPVPSDTASATAGAAPGASAAAAGAAPAASSAPAASAAPAPSAPVPAQTASTDVGSDLTHVLKTVTDFLHQLLTAFEALGEPLGNDASAAGPSTKPPAAPVTANGGAAMAGGATDAGAGPGPGPDSSSARVDFSLKLRIFQSIVATASVPSMAPGPKDSTAAGTTDAGSSVSTGTASADKASALLSDTVDALAAQQQPPLDASA